MTNRIKKYNIVYVILALIASVLLWLYVVTAEDPDAEVQISNINVVFTGENEILADRNLMLVDGKSLTVSLKIRAKRSTIMRLDNEKITITADLSDIETPGDYRRSYRISYPEGVASSSVTVLERYPSMIDLKIDRLEARTIEIQGEIQGNIEEGFLAEAFVFDPKTVKVNGPLEEISKISHALVTLNRTNIEKSITSYLPFVLIDEEGKVIESDLITTDIIEIKTTLPILKIKEIPINVDLLSGGGATHENAVYTVNPAMITISGPIELVDGINMITVGVIDLAQVSGTGEFQYQILIPNGIQNISGETTAEVDIEIKGLETRRLDADNIVIMNEPDIYRVTPVTKSVPVLLRGEASSISLVMRHNIRVVADLAEVNMSPGSHIVPAKIYIDGYSGVGAVGDYQIAVNVERK